VWQGVPESGSTWPEGAEPVACGSYLGYIICVGVSKRITVTLIRLYI